jgi:hypothetical protein
VAFCFWKKTKFAPKTNSENLSIVLFVAQITEAGKWNFERLSLSLFLSLSPSGTKGRGADSKLGKIKKEVGKMMTNAKFWLLSKIDFESRGAKFV